MEKPTRFETIPAGCRIEIVVPKRGDWVWSEAAQRFNETSGTYEGHSRYPVLRPADPPWYHYGNVLPWDLPIPQGYEPDGGWCGEKAALRMPGKGDWLLGTHGRAYQWLRDWDEKEGPRLILRRVPEKVSEKVRIWSPAMAAYWRSYGVGYSTAANEAGIYTRKQAELYHEENPSLELVPVSEPAPRKVTEVTVRLDQGMPRPEIDGRVFFEVMTGLMLTGTVTRVEEVPDEAA